MIPRSILLILFSIAQHGSYGRDCYTNRGIVSMFNESCYEAVGSESQDAASAGTTVVSDGHPTNVCPEAWNAFMSAFTGREFIISSSRSSYNDYFAVFPIAPGPNDVLFWSGTPVLTDFVSSMNENICSSFTVTSSEVVNGLGVDACWCGTSCGGINYDTPCSHDDTSSFWASFSCMLGANAKGIVFWLTWGERPGGAYQPGGFFGLYEFPALQSPRVSRLVVFSVHRDGMGESCAQGSLITLKNESKSKFGASDGYGCYDIIGDAKTTNMTEQHRLADMIVPIIRMEQSKCTRLGVLYSVGQTVPSEHPCNTTCICTTERRIACSLRPVLCESPLSCQDGLLPVSNKEPGQCCTTVTCENTTCLHEGTHYRIGQTVRTYDPCQSCVCTDSGIHCSVVGCPLSGCSPGMYLKSVPVPGQCCPHQECVIITCEYEGQNYTAGPVPTEDPCTECRCTENGLDCDLTHVSLCPKSLLSRCLDGRLPVSDKEPGQCCPTVTCENTTCLHEDIHYRIEQTVRTYDPCQSCVCTGSGIQCSVVVCPLHLIACSPWPGACLKSVPVPGQCCPLQQFMNTTCVYKGQNYTFGPVPTGDPFTECECTCEGLQCSFVRCPSIDCPPGTVMKVGEVPGQSCLRRICEPLCPPTCSKSYCRGANKSAVCSRPSETVGDSSCLRTDCSVTTCKACYFARSHRPLPGGCDRFSTCEVVRNNPMRLDTCLQRWGQCIGKKDKAQYGKVRRFKQRSRNFKCYSYPC